jgi:hypothetical protein
MGLRVRMAVASLGVAAIAGCASIPDYCAPGTPECTAADAGRDALVDAIVDTADASASDDSMGAVDSGEEPEATAESGGDATSCNATQAPHDAPCVIDDAYGVFVAPPSSGGSDVTGAGTRAASYATITWALNHRAGKANVYVCTGSYAEKVTIAQAVGVFGGLSCAGGVWSYSGARTSVASPSNDYALKIDTVAGAVVIEDMAFSSPSGSGQDSQGNGRSSLGAIVSGSAQVTLRRCAFAAGNGDRGTDALMASNYGDGATAPAGYQNSGATGGGGGVAGCTSGSSAGGRGGDGAVGSTQGADGGASPMPTTNPGQSLDGLGGTGGANSCGNGDPGANGAGGAAGAPATKLGSLTGSGWAPSPGGAGGSGNPGQGGGGGGGKSTAKVGGTGGGAGGCGGAGGPGGGGGGASIALACVASMVSLDSCVLTAKSGGQGGKGADAQVGQAGGPSPTNGSACFGGYGGNGAGGSGGAGGTGGLSACVVYMGSAPAGSPACTLGSAGMPGAGGKGAAGGDNMQGNPGTAGADGAVGGAGAAQNLLQVP